MEPKMGKDLPVIGFVGLGNMGGPMCLRLAAAGYPVVAYDLNAEALARAVAGGARAGASAADCAAQADVFLTNFPPEVLAKSQPLLERNAVDVGGVQQPRGLLLDGGGHGWVVVAESADGDAAEGVQIAAPVLVPEPGAFTALEGDWQALVGWHEMLPHRVAAPASRGLGGI